MWWNPLVPSHKNLAGQVLDHWPVSLPWWQRHHGDQIRAFCAPFGRAGLPGLRSTTVYLSIPSLLTLLPLWPPVAYSHCPWSVLQTMSLLCLALTQFLISPRPSPMAHKAFSDLVFPPHTTPPWCPRCPTYNPSTLCLRAFTLAIPTAWKVVLQIYED